MEKENFKFEKQEELPRKIEKDNIKPRLPEIGETEIIFQRHGKYERSTDSPNVGSLTEEGAEEIYSNAIEYFKNLLENLSEEEKEELDFLIIGSDTQYEGGGRRSMETAEQVLKALKEELNESNIDESRILNETGKFKGDKGPRPTPKLREPQMFEESPEFVEFLKDKYGDKDLSFWIAFEEDVEKEKREELGAEGPDDIADRMKKMKDILVRFGNMYHKKHPERRLIIWATTHYDTISPFVKREVLKVGKEVPLGVDYGAGISISTSDKGEEIVNIGDKKYNLKEEKERSDRDT